MATTKTFKLAKYPDEAGLNGAEVTWDNADTIEEGVRLGMYESEEAIIRAANAYRDVQVGHAIRRAFDRAIKDEKEFTIEDAQELASDYQQGVGRTRSGGGSRKPKLENRVKPSVFESAPAEKLAVLLEFGTITQAEYDAELARRNA